MNYFNEHLSHILPSDGTQVTEISQRNGINNLYTIITAENNYSYQAILVPVEFEEKVLVHVVSHYIANNHFFEPPLYLAIEGPAGEGKTSQTIAALTQRNIDVVYVSASKLSGNHEKEALQLMEIVYSAAKNLANQKRCVAIVIDDFHMGIINQDENVKKTINTSLLTGFMMNLVDSTTECKIPIILTGNDFSNVYAPLLRSGRADHFKWIPSEETKYQIIKHILNPIVDLSEYEFSKFFKEYKNGTISDFAQIKNSYRKKYLWDIIRDTRDLGLNNLNRLQGLTEREMQRITYKELCNLADARISRKQNREGK